ncbi:MAG: bile acid:sodium symporter family protein [Pirellulaceae bacterium]
MARYGFLLLLITSLLGGMAAARPLHPLAELAWLRDGIVATVMLGMSLQLDLHALWRSLRKPGALLLAVTISYGVLPSCAWLLSFSLPTGLAAGLQVAAVTPCTLASAALWTRRAGGNEALALLVTVVTNGLCWLLIPGWLYLMMGHSQPLALPMSSVMSQLAGLVVIPLLAGQGAVRHPSIRQWTIRYRRILGWLAQGGILAMVLLGAIRTGLTLRDRGDSVSVVDLGWMLALVVGLHLAMFALGLVAGKWCGYGPEDCLAIGFSGSQKTLMVGVLLAILVQASVLPMVAYHCLQLVIDTVLADHGRRLGGRL